LIFDSDVVIWMLRRREKALRFARAVDLGERTVSVVSYLEILRGCRDRREADALKEFIEEWFTEVLAVDGATGDRALSLMSQFASSRHPAVDDMLIAATALGRREMLATGNAKHFEFIPGLVVQRFEA